VHVFSDLAYGFQVAFQPINLLFAFLGVFIGTAVGVLPGLGAPGAIALLLPLTFGMDPVVAIVTVAGIYYGTMYGGSTTSILVNIPGEAASVVTALDGHAMARKGRAGVALGMCTFASFIAGTVGVILLSLGAPLLQRFALDFGPIEYTVLLGVGLGGAAFVGSGSQLKSFMMMLLGLGFGVVGIDPIVGSQRFTFDTIYLLDGIKFVVVVMGIFGITEVLTTVYEGAEDRRLVQASTRFVDLLPNRQDWREASPAIARGTFLGFFLGLLPGGGAVLASFLSYALEKRVSRYPERFGTGAIEGVAGPEAANNSAASAAFVPLLTLGIPFNAVAALILAALLIQGIRPGPLLVTEHPEIFWGVIASMYIGNVMLLVLNLPLIGVFVQFLKIPYPILFPGILLITMVGSYSIDNNLIDIVCALAFGIGGFGLRLLGFELAPLALGLVLGPMFEASFRQALIISRGNPTIIFSHPIAMIVITGVVIAVTLSLTLRWRQRSRLREASTE
jgi:putative tricarboxylic transport membrane protein